MIGTRVAWGSVGFGWREQPRPTLGASGFADRLPNGLVGRGGTMDSMMTPSPDNAFL